MFYKNTTPADVKEVLKTAALLDTSEIIVFRLAYSSWFGKLASDALIESHFTAYTFARNVPFWVHNFTRNILAKAEDGSLQGEIHGLSRPPASVRSLMPGMLFAILLFLIAGLLIFVTSAV